MLISSITDMEVFRPYVEKDKEENVYKIKLINYNDFDLNTATKRLFGQVCMENHITVAGKIKYTSELTVPQNNYEFVLPIHQNMKLHLFG